MLVDKITSEVKFSRDTIEIYCKGIIVGVYDIWRIFLKHVGVGLNKRILQCDYSYT